MQNFFLGGGVGGKQSAITHNRHKKITDYNEQRAKRERKWVSQKFINFVRH